MCVPQRNAVRGAVMLEGWAADHDDAERMLSDGRATFAAERPLAGRGGRDDRRHLALHGAAGRRATRWAAAWPGQPDERRSGRGVLARRRLPGGDPPPAPAGRGDRARLRRRAARRAGRSTSFGLCAQGDRDGRRLPHAPPGDDHAAAARGAAGAWPSARRSQRAPDRADARRQRPLRPDADDRRRPGRARRRPGTPRLERGGLHQPQRHRRRRAARRAAGPLVHAPRRRWWATRSTGPASRTRTPRRTSATPRSWSASASAARPARQPGGGRLPGRRVRRRARADARRWATSASARSERLRIPFLDGEGTPLGVDARACVDLGETPLINTGILHAGDGRPDRRRRRPHAARAHPRRPARAGAGRLRLIWSDSCQEARREGPRERAFLVGQESAPGRLDGRGQTDIRGLVTRMTGCPAEAGRCLRSSVALVGCS